MNQISLPKCRTCCFQNPQRALKSCASLLLVGGMKCNCVFLTIERIFQNFPENRVPKNFSDVVDFQVFAGLIPFLWSKCTLPGSPTYLPLLALEHGVINIVDECDIQQKIQAVQVLSEYVRGLESYCSPGASHKCMLLFIL